MNLRLPPGIVFFFLVCLLVPLASLTAPAAPYEEGVTRFWRCGYQTDNGSQLEKARQQIGISVPQQAQLEHLYADADKKEKALEEQLHDLYNRQRTLYDAYFIDHAQERDLRKSIGQLHVQILLIHADTEEKLRKILTHDQFDRLSAVLQAHRRGSARRNGRHRHEEKGRPQNDGRL